MSLAYSFTWPFWAFPHMSVPRQLPGNATHVELTVGNSELIVSDSELSVSHIPLVVSYIYISLESYR